MKRKPIQNFVKQIKTLFKWNKCHICGLEVRRENIWEIHLRTLNYNPQYIYACLDCCKSEEEALNLREKVLNYKPIGPPPHPPKRPTGGYLNIDM